MSAMSPDFAAFNCHINNAKTKARRRFIKRFGLVVWQVQIKPFLKAGIMSIFHETPNTYTQFYVDQITEIVNEGRS